MVICLEQGADLHMAQLMPLPLAVYCFSKIQIGFTFLVPAHPGSPGQRAIKRVCVCVYSHLNMEKFTCTTSITRSVAALFRHCLNPYHGTGVDQEPQKQCSYVSLRIGKLILYVSPFFANAMLPPHTFSTATFLLKFVTNAS